MKRQEKKDKLNDKVRVLLNRLESESIRRIVLRANLAKYEEKLES